MPDLLTPDDLSTDSDGAPLRYRNTYRCDDCDEVWQDDWSCGCDDECPSCGCDISPEDSEDLLAPYYAANRDEHDPADGDNRSPSLLRNLVCCDTCGRMEHIDLLDAKPDEPDNPDGCDWNRLECIACYGPGWCPAPVRDVFALSVCDELAGLYRGWRIVERFRDWRGDVRSFLRRLWPRMRAPLR